MISDTGEESWNAANSPGRYLAGFIGRFVGSAHHMSRRSSRPSAFLSHASAGSPTACAVSDFAKKRTPTAGASRSGTATSSGSISGALSSRSTPAGPPVEGVSATTLNSSLTSRAVTSLPLPSTTIHSRSPTIPARPTYASSTGLIAVDFTGWMLIPARRMGPIEADTATRR